MHDFTQAYNESVLAQVKDPRQRLELARILDDSDAALSDMVMKEARARDTARAKAQKAKTGRHRRAQGKR